MFGKLGDVMALQKKIKALKKELDNTYVECEKLGGKIRVTMSGSQIVKELIIEPEAIAEQKLEVVRKNLLECINDAILKSQRIAADRMKNVSGLNIPGIM